MSDGGSVDRDALAQAEETIRRQAREIEQMQARIDAARFAEDLREALIAGASAGTIATPVTHGRLLEMIVETAAQVISAQAAALFLIDEPTGELVFEIALGQKASEVKRFRVPIGHGIAGLVAATGQPMAIHDAQSDPRQAADIAEQVGHVPNSILCVPLFFNDQIIGVLELLDKAGGLPFTNVDMNALGLFANLTAVAIEQSLTHQNLVRLIEEIVHSLGNMSDQERDQLLPRARAFALEMEHEDTAYRRALELARLVQEIVWQGENEAVACHTILQGFADYLRTRAQPMIDIEALR